MNNLMHHLDVELLRRAYQALNRKAARGVDGLSWEEYGQALDARLHDLHRRLHGGRYRPQPVRRVWIPKADGRQRPLGVTSVEDKLVQQALVFLLNPIYETDFKGFSYGFRPGRSQHHALDALHVALTQRKVSWILDTDISAFFDSVDHGWLMKFVAHRVADRRVLRLIEQTLSAGVVEEGQWHPTRSGTPQGGVLSPLLANIYLHYSLDLWVEAWRKRHARGDVYIVRYADDAVLGFQYRDDAKETLIYSPFPTSTRPGIMPETIQPKGDCHAVELFRTRVCRKEETDAPGPFSGATRGSDALESAGGDARSVLPQE